MKSPMSGIEDVGDFYVLTLFFLFLCEKEIIYNI